MYQGSMQDMMERYKQELYNYRQRSKTSETEPASVTMEQPVLEASAAAEPEALPASASSEEAVPVSADFTETPEPAYREANVTVPENPVDFRYQPLDVAPSLVLPNVGAPVETEEETPKVPDEYELFQQENPGTGTLKVQVSTARGAIPLENAAVYVTKEFNGKPRVFFSGVTDADGIVTGISLRAPAREESLQPEEVPPYATYNIYVSAAGYRPEEFKGVPIFDGVQSIQPVSMTPENETNQPPEVIVEEEPDL